MPPRSFTATLSRLDRFRARSWSDPSRWYGCTLVVTPRDEVIRSCECGDYGRRGSDWCKHLSAAWRQVIAPLLRRQGRHVPEPRWDARVSDEDIARHTYRREGLAELRPVTNPEALALMGEPIDPFEDLYPPDSRTWEAA